MPPTGGAVLERRGEAQMNKIGIIALAMLLVFAGTAFAQEIQYKNLRGNISEGLSIKNLVGTNDYECEKLSIKLIQVTKTNAGGNYTATLGLYDDDNDLVDTKTAKAGAMLESLFSSDGQTPILDKIKITSIGVGSTNGVAYLKYKIKRPINAPVCETGETNSDQNTTASTNAGGGGGTLANPVTIPIYYNVPSNEGSAIINAIGALLGNNAKMCDNSGTCNTLNQISAIENGAKFTVTVPSLPSGTYELILNQPNGRTTKIIIVNLPIPSTETCTDSDGGRNYYVQGRTIGTCTYCSIESRNKNVSDLCAKDAGYDKNFTNALFEYSCQNGKFASETYYCENGCSNGACIQKVADKTKVSAYLYSASNDQAGIWNNFGPGTGNANKTKYDWEWDATLYLNEKKTIKSITIMHDRTGAASYGEAWSTSKKDVYGKQPYPLVVYNSGPTLRGAKLNTAYDQTLGTYTAGQYPFILFGQIEAQKFYGGILRAEFSDGTSVDTYIPESSITAPNDQSTDISCIDYDSNQDYYLKWPSNISQIKNPDLFRFDKATGIYSSKSSNAGNYIYSEDGNVFTYRISPYNYDIFYDSCATSTQLNEAYCHNGKIWSIGIQCPNGCRNGACIAGQANLSPYVSYIPQVTLDQANGGSNYLVDLWKYVSDEDPKDKLTYTVTNQTYNEVVNCKVIDNRYLGCAVSPQTPKYNTNMVTIRVTDTQGKYAETAVTVNILSQKVPAGPSVAADLKEAENDYAGPWNTFKPGLGRISTIGNDWHWTMYLVLDDTKTIKSISIKHDQTGAASYGEAWSTGSDQIYGKTAYPLVVFQNWKQINEKYDQTLGTYNKGTNIFDLYGQIETRQFYGGTIEVEFTDGTKASARILPSGVVPKNLITGNTDIPKPLPSAKASLSSANEDYAGIWNAFTKGKGRISNIPNDWHWKATISNPAGRTIKSISIRHNQTESAAYGEAWSTTSDNIYGKQPYPLVVLQNGAQLNTAYGQAIMPSDDTNAFDLYGQIEAQKFYAGTLEITFTDGTSISSEIAASDIKPVVSEQEFDQLPEPVLGLTNAPVKATVYFGFKDPFTKILYQNVLTRLLRENDGNIQIEFTNFPLSFQTNSKLSAIAGECANEQGKFADYAALIFNGAGTELNKDELKNYAGQVNGMNTAQFNACLDSDKYLSEVNNDIKKAPNVSGTPTVVLTNGLRTEQIVGAQTYEVFSNTLISLLRK